MGVDISTWRARVGMFIQRTSQPSLIIFRAKTHSPSANHHKASRPAPGNPILIPETGIRESGSSQRDDYKPNSAQPADKPYLLVVWTLLFSYIFYLLVVLSVSLIASPSELRPSSSYPPVLIDPDKNESSPFQLSSEQWLIILMSGDVEVNPGPRNPGPKNPGPPNPVSLNPGPPKPGPPNRGPPNPGPPNPGPPNPGPPNPGPPNPGTPCPGPLNPGPLNPSVPNPGLPNPGPPNPGPPNPGSSNPGPPNPGPPNPGSPNPGPPNPGPPNAGPVNPSPAPNIPNFKQIAEELTKLTVPAEDVTCPEYCCNIDVDFTLKKKNGGTRYVGLMEDIVRTVCAMLNYAGGVITLNPQTANTDKDLDEWVDKIQQQIDSVVPKEVSRCIETKTKSGHIEIWLQKSWKFITYKLPLYIRRGNGTHDGDISMIAGNVLTKPLFVSMVAGIQWNQLNHGDRFPLSEGKNLEFKCYRTCDATSLMAKITNDTIRGEPKLIKTLLAFTNTEGGGDAIIGIKEVQGAPILEGQKLSAADEEIVRRCFDELMIKGLNDEQRIWPSTPQSGSEWTIKFYTLRNCPSNNRHVLIHIRVNQVAGCVLADEPEAYTMTPEGNIRHVPLNEWKNCIKPPSIKPSPELLKLGPDSEEQDNDDDDTDEEQFKQLADDLKSHRVTLSHIKTASWTKDSEDSQDDIVPGVNMDTCVEEVSKSKLLMPSHHSSWVPDKKIIDRWVTNNHPDMKKCVDAIAQSHSQEAVVIGTRYFGHLFPKVSLEMPQHHVFDFFVLQDNAEVDLWILFEDCGDIVTCKNYANSAIRILRSQLLSHMHQHTDTKEVKLVIKAKVWSIADNCFKYDTTGAYTESTVNLPILQKAVAYCLLQGQSHIRNRLGEEYLTALTKDQLSACLHYPYMNVIVFQGPPGSGKSIIAQHLCEREARARNLVKDKILYICPCQPLAEFIKFQGRCEVKFTKSKKLLRTIRKALMRGILLVIVDDAHLFQCSKGEWYDLLKLFKPRDKGSAERHLAIFLDPVYQNFLGDKTRNLFEAIFAFNHAHAFCKIHVHEALPVVIRNSRGIFSFFKTNAEAGRSALTCAHDFQGAGVSVSYTSENFFQRDINNPVIKLTKEIVGLYNFEESFTYQETDITILVDTNNKRQNGNAVQKLLNIFQQYYREAKIQRASVFPVRGIVIEELKSFSGLETRVCILVLTCKNTSVISNPRYKCFVASRGITKLVFLLHGDTVGSSFRQLKFSEEQQWQKLTRQLLKEIPEKGLSDEWLKANVPDTECWHKTKPFAMLRCQKQIKLTEDHRRLADWMDSHISPAWRQDAQLVRAVIGSVCKRTMRQTSSGHEVDLKEIRPLLSALNCLYGAPESIQHQALDSVYDYVESLKHPEKILHKVLDMMWSDGFISRQAILSWIDNMEQTKRQTWEINLQAKDLIEQIQERMRARQEVREWMEERMRTSQEVRWWMGHTTQMGYYWYNSPHYQRVALHALCQLAVTWQGDKCTVDKDLLFLYVPQLFCNTSDGLQLLYAVQCVLYHLQNPSGLAAAVIQAVLTISRSGIKYKPVITTTDWDKWRNSENRVYEESRYIIQQQGQILGLIVLVSSDVNLPEIDGWISGNLPQDQMQDAFIITAVYLINRGEEVTLIRDWISQNLPQTMKTPVHDMLKTIMIPRCVPIMQDWSYWKIAYWVDRHILPAWRRDEQFVRAVIKAVCMRTIHPYKIDYEILRCFLGALNCLYGAPESLQLQALDSVYDHVKTMKNPEKVLPEFLQILWSDGYISRQAILSWSDNMEETSVMRLAEILSGSKKDLGEQIQERMRTRQEVRRWIGDTTVIGLDWYDSSHYQLVALHALCQLAVTRQGDKCTVDKDLLFHYIPHLYCYTRHGLQLLYAVQCVLHHLQNPPGLAVAVLQAVLTITRPNTDDEPVIITTDSEEWRNTQNPTYDEGRNIIQQQEQLLDLIVLVSSEVTLTEINGWIYEKIPKDQMLDAFIIAAVCLVHRGEEVTLISNWISQNVPQSMKTAVHDTLKTIMIRSAPIMQNWSYWEIAYWVDGHILPAWRRDAQFVRAVIKAVCMRTIHLDKIDSEILRGYLGALNCLYGAPEALQHQALDSVYDYVRTLQNPEKVLPEFLEILWSDRYISRQATRSWSGNMDETSVMRLAEILSGSKKDLGEQIQERMRTGQEVRRWMGDTIEIGLDWYDSSHYQGVALHALCQLAVTWQVDKCTVDKDPLFYYIPHIFCYTRDGLQLLYTVQCVLYHLSNPPELAVTVLQTVLAISRPDTDDEPVITTSDLDKWRNAQNPDHDEGRNVIQQQGQLLDLIVLVSSEVKLTKINGWICEKIPQDQMLDAFIIAAVCLLNRREELTLTKDWISENVPQSMMTTVQDTLKTIIIQRCVQRILYSEDCDHIRLADWVDTHILPAWRQDPQFVRAVIKAVCMRTIHQYKIDSKELKCFLGAVNCLYGAPDSLQIQALDSLYDYVKTTQCPLQEVLDIMWSDGYISKQAILTWSGDKDQTTPMSLQGILSGSGKDLGGRIQKRMRARQEVRRWMGDTTQMGYYWDDCPHYQRVALHALCQLAVTWQGDKCTVDKHLLFHYVPQLFCNTILQLQLLYSVQSVAFVLGNPPGLAVTVLEALGSPIPKRTESIITESHLKKWINIKHPAYEEGRESMLLDITNLNL